MGACGRCGAANRDERKFCGECGAPQARPCAACQFENLATEKFCGGCGTPLGQPPVKSAPTTQAGERREATVLFADIAGYTKLSNELDPEDTHSLLQRFFEISDGVIAHFGGRVDKHIGDNVMAVFGAPMAHDNDPERAVRAAEEIHRRVAAMAGPRKIQVHIGLATGEVIASALGSSHHQEYGVIGDTVNLAARLQDKASAGETIVSDIVRNATASFARYADLGEISLKGFKQPVRPYRFEGFLETRVEARRRGFVGREAELAELTALLEATAREGKGKTVVVRGEAGIGKTRLLAEVRTTAERLGYRCHRALILDFGEGVGQGPVRMLAEQLLGVTERAGAAERRAAVDRATTDGTVAPERALPLAMLLDCALTDAERLHADNMTQAARETALRACVAELVERSVANAPLFLSFEDAHWADATTIGYLAAISELVGRYPIVLAVTTRREGDVPLAPHRALLEQTSARVIDLTPFSADDAARLAGQDAPRELVSECIARSGGNPLFLEQLLEAGRTGSGSALPSTLQSVILARLDRLAPEMRNALQVASVFGQRFSPDAVRRTLGEPGFVFDSLVATGLLRPDGEALIFKHALIHEGVYQALTRGRRKELHLKAAELEQDPVLRAKHLDRAQDPRASRAYIEAANAQLSHHLLDSALQLATRGRELADSSEARFALAMKRGEILQARGLHRDAMPAYEDALANAATQADQCKVLLQLAAAQRYASDYAGATATMERVKPLAEALGDDEALSALHYFLGGLCFIKGDAPACKREGELALQFAERCGNGERMARAHSGLGDANMLTGDYGAAGFHFERCLELCEQHGLERFAPPNLAMLGNVRAIEGDQHDAMRLCEKAYALAKRLGDERSAFFAHQELVCFQAEMMPAEEGAKVLTACADEATRMGLTLYSVMMNAYASETLLDAGQTEEALRRVRIALEVPGNPWPQFSAAANALLARLEKDPARRRAILAETTALRSSFTGFTVLTVYRLAVEAALANADLPLAEHYLDEWATAMKRHTEPMFVSHLTSSRLRVAALRDKREPGLRSALEAHLAELREQGFVVRAARIERTLRELSET